MSSPPMITWKSRYIFSCVTRESSSILDSIELQWRHQSQLHVHCALLESFRDSDRAIRAFWVKKNLYYIPELSSITLILFKQSVKPKEILKKFRQTIQILKISNYYFITVEQRTSIERVSNCSQCNDLSNQNLISFLRVMSHIYIDISWAHQ